MKKIGASKFREHCLALIDDLEPEGVVITRRGKPVAVIVPYDEYLQSRRRDALQTIMEARQVFRKAGLSGEEIAREARKELETSF